jgi:hypothetical protein
VRLIRRVDFQDFYEPISVILPVLDGKLSANVDVNRASGIVSLCIIGMRARFTLESHESVSEKKPLPARKRLQQLNDLIVNEQPAIHSFSPGPVSSRRSNSSKVANFPAGLSTFSDSFLR